MQKKIGKRGKIAENVTYSERERDRVEKDINNMIDGCKISFCFSAKRELG